MSCFIYTVHSYAFNLSNACILSHLLCNNISPYEFLLCILIEYSIHSFVLFMPFRYVSILRTLILHTHYAFPLLHFCLAFYFIFHSYTTTNSISVLQKYKAFTFKCITLSSHGGYPCRILRMPKILQSPLYDELHYQGLFLIHSIYT